MNEKEYVRFMKNSRGYVWEIEVEGNNPDRIKELNDKMETLFGGFK